MGCAQVYGMTHPGNAVTLAQPWIVTEMCGASLFECIHTLNRHLFQWDWLLQILYDISLSMAFIHCRGIIHRDLNLDNIMVSLISSPLHLKRILA